MNNGYAKAIRERIASAKDGTIFIASDFADIADAATIRQTLNRLVKSDILHRAARGIYQKPKYSQLLKEYVVANPEKIAEAVARSYHWTIAPSGNTALNLLGLSTQVPAVWSYISNGPSRKYQWGKTKVEFKHRTSREITGLSFISILVIQALKTLGKDRVTDKEIMILSKRLTREDKDTLMKECKESTDWVYDIIRRICAEQKPDNE